MRPFTLHERQRFLRHGLGDPDRQPACKGYANGCDCTHCTDTVNLIAKHHEAGRWPFTGAGDVKPLPAKKAPRQPWEVKAA